MTRRGGFGLIAFLFLAGFSAVPLAAQYQGRSLGFGGEANAITLFEDLGLGAQFAVEDRINRYFALDFHAIASSLLSRLPRIATVDSFISFEALLYLRFYPFAPREMDMTGTEFFLGVGGGVLSTLKGLDFHYSRGSPEASATMGARFRLSSRFYVEPYIRVGWPSLLGGGVMAGFRFPMRLATGTIVREETSVRGAESPVDETFVVFFAPNEAGFDGLDEASVRRNEETLSTIRRLLGESPSARLFIEGYGDTAADTQEGARPSQRPLSERRAAYTVRNFIDRGIDPERLIYIGGDSNRSAASVEGREKWGPDRVEIRFIR